ncbi:MAG: hypothetical protein ABSH51_32115 [Solirubrobacteraceae bacterium]
MVAQILRFEGLPVGSMASRRSVVRWSDGGESEALRYDSDEVQVSELCLVGKTREQIRLQHFARTSPGRSPDRSQALIA